MHVHRHTQHKHVRVGRRSPNVSQSPASFVSNHWQRAGKCHRFPKRMNSIDFQLALKQNASLAFFTSVCVCVCVSIACYLASPWTQKQIISIERFVAQEGSEIRWNVFRLQLKTRRRPTGPRTGVCDATQAGHTRGHTALVSPGVWTHGDRKTSTFHLLRVLVPLDLPRSLHTLGADSKA